MTDHPILEFLDDDWRDAIDADDPDYPELPEWLQTVRAWREPRDG